MNWFLKVVRNYAVFEGRARRKEFWLYELIYIIFFSALALIDRFIGSYDVEGQIGLLSGLLALGLLLPTIGVTIRRLHDTDRAGWWLLLVFLPIIGGIWLLVLMVLGGSAGENRFGPDPLDEPEP